MSLEWRGQSSKCRQSRGGGPGRLWLLTAAGAVAAAAVLLLLLLLLLLLMLLLFIPGKRQLRQFKRLGIASKLKSG